jgi:hypothetical protein
MTTEKSGADLIERYLRTRRLRYFRGQHDGEYFFILGRDHKPLHVHLEIPREGADGYRVRVTPGYFFPAMCRARLSAFVDTWNRTDRWTKAVVHESCDPTRIGVRADNAPTLPRATQVDEFAGFVDRTIESAIQFFAELTPVVEADPTSSFEPLVLDAG